MELAFFQAAGTRDFPIHFTLAKTGVRPGELIHLLIEDLDLAGGWMHVRNKPELSWRIKTRQDRSVPVAGEVIAVLRQVIGSRSAGPVFLRGQFDAQRAPLADAGREAMAKAFARRIEKAEQQNKGALSREQVAKLARTVWRDAGAVKADRIRLSFIRIASAAGIAGATCPKSWRNSFATLVMAAILEAGGTVRPRHAVGQRRGCFLYRV